MKRKYEHKDHVQKLLIETIAPIEDPISKESFYKKLSCHFSTLSSNEAISSQQAALQSFRINKIDIPHLYYRYALYLNDEFKRLGQNIKEEQLKGLIEIEEEVNTLKSLFSLQKIKQSLSITIQTEIAKSHELIADIQYDIYILNENNPTYLLEHILKNYSKSLTNKFDVQVWLSVINTRRLLIEKLKNCAIGFYEKEILREIEAIIDAVTNFSFEIDKDSRMIMISDMLYACATGYQLNTKQSNVYIQKAFNLVRMNLNLLIKNQNKAAYEDLYQSMLNHLKILGINKNIEKLKPNSTTEACIHDAEKLIDAAKDSSDFDIGTLISSPQETESKGLKENYLLIAKKNISAKQPHLEDSLKSGKDFADFSHEKTNPIHGEEEKKSANQYIAQTLPFFNIPQFTQDKEALSLIKKKRAIESLTVQQIVNHDDSIFYLMATGAVFACGNNKYGQLGIGNTDNQYSLVKLSLPAVSQIVMRDRASFFLTTKGEVFACGKNEGILLGNGNTEDQLSPVKLSLPAVSKMITNELYTFFLTKTGKVFVCGRDEMGQLGVESNCEQILIPIQLSLPEVSEMITAYPNSNYFITTTGEVFVCGSNDFGVLGIGQIKIQHIPIKLSLPAVSKIVIDFEASSTFFLTTTGEVYACGYNGYGQLGVGNDNDQYLPVKLSVPAVSQIITNEIVHSIFITTTGEVFACGYSDDDIEGTENRGLPIKLPLPAISQVVMESFSAFLLTTAGKVFIYKGPNIENRHLPYLTPLPAVSSMVTYGNSTFFLTTTGEVFAHGNNQYGQLGTGNTKKENTPVKLSLTSVTKILTNSGSTFFFTVNGEVFACGDNYCGQLGIGNTEEPHLPIKLSHFDRAKAVRHWDIPTLEKLAIDDGPNHQFFCHVLKEKKADLNPWHPSKEDRKVSTFRF